AVLKDGGSHAAEVAVPVSPERGQAGAVNPRFGSENRHSAPDVLCSDAHSCPCRNLFCPAADRVLNSRRGRISGILCGVVMPLVPTRMEDIMCWEIDYKFFAEQKKAKEIEQQRRAGVIDQLLNDAAKQGDKQGEKSDVEKTSIRESAPAK